MLGGAVQQRHDKIDAYATNCGNGSWKGCISENIPTDRGKTAGKREKLNKQPHNESSTNTERYANHVGKNREHNMGKKTNGSERYGYIPEINARASYIMTQVIPHCIYHVGAIVGAEK